MNNFGYSSEKFEKSIQHFEQQLGNHPNKKEVVQRMRIKKEASNKWFIAYQRKRTMDILEKMTYEFAIANSIYPSETPAKIMEYCERRKHLNNAISEAYALAQKLQYVMKVLPVDMNKYQRFADMIDVQIALFKGIRQADNKFLKPKNKNKKTQSEANNQIL